jgi:FkbM family methyltransferase
MSLFSRATHKLKSFQWDMKNRVYETLLRKLDLELLLDSGVRVKVASYADWTIYTAIFADNEYDEPIRAALRQTPPLVRLNVLDLGANVGFFALRVAHMLAQDQNETRDFCIACVEASPSTYAQLEKRLLSSPALQGHYKIVNALAGERAGIGRIYPASYHAMTSSRQSGKAKGIDVPFVDIETLFPAGESIALLKCDIEGSEGDVLRNYADLLRRTRVAVFEIHHDKCDPILLRDTLSALGLTRQQVLRQDAFNTVELFQRDAA